MTCSIDLPFSLGRISQFLNFYNPLLPFKPGDRVRLSEFLHILDAKKIEIANTIDKLQAYTSFVDVVNNVTYFQHLENSLNDFHREASNLKRLYDENADI